MKYIRMAGRWLRNAFVFKRPTFSHFEYVDYITAGKNYFVFSWKIEHAYQLKIKPANFRSVLKSGSAYIRLPNNVNQLEIVISGAWKNTKYPIDLKQIVIEDPIEFPITIKTGFEAKIVTPTVKSNFSKLTVNAFKVKKQPHTQIKNIININYPN